MKALVRMGTEFVVTCGILFFGVIKLFTRGVSLALRGVHSAAKWIDSHPDKVIESLLTVDHKVHNWALGENRDKNVSESGNPHT